MTRDEQLTAAIKAMVNQSAANPNAMSAAQMLSTLAISMIQGDEPLDPGSVFFALGMAANAVATVSSQGVGEEDSKFAGMNVMSYVIRQKCVVHEVDSPANAMIFKQPYGAH